MHETFRKLGLRILATDIKTKPWGTHNVGTIWCWPNNHLSHDKIPFLSPNWNIPTTSCCTKHLTQDRKLVFIFVSMHHSCLLWLAKFQCSQCPTAYHLGFWASKNNMAATIDSLFKVRLYPGVWVLLVIIYQYNAYWYWYMFTTA